MLERFERRLTAAERDRLLADRLRIERERTAELVKGAAASLLVCGALAAVTVLASDARFAVIATTWAAIAVLIAGWIALSAWRERAQRTAALTEALATDRVRVTRIASARMVEFEEYEDEGACYAFDVGEGRTVFVAGQQYYANDRFPASDFSILETLGPNGIVADERIEVAGAPLQPERVVDRETKVRLAIPEHLEVVDVPLGGLEQGLPPLAG